MYALDAWVLGCGEGTYVFVVEVIKFGIGQEDRDLGVEAYDPGEREDVVEKAKKDGEL